MRIREYIFSIMTFNDRIPSAVIERDIDNTYENKIVDVRKCDYDMLREIVGAIPVNIGNTVYVCESILAM